MAQLTAEGLICLHCEPYISKGEQKKTDLNGQMVPAYKVLFFSPTDGTVIDLYNCPYDLRKTIPNLKETKPLRVTMEQATFGDKTYWKKVLRVE